MLLGEKRARHLTQAMMAGFYVTVVICVALPRPALARSAGCRRASRTGEGVAIPGRAQARCPAAQFPVWPLWFAAIAFLHTRRAGALLVLGLAVAAAAGVRIHT